MPERFDPTHEGRVRFLRKIHKLTLHDRACITWGDKGPSILAQLKAAYVIGQGNSPGAFDYWVRHVMRRCGAIDGMEGERRRLAYARACIADLTNGEDRSVTNPIAVIMEKTGISGRKVMMLAMQLYETLDVTDVETRAAKARGILVNATRKHHPLRYIRKVIENEKGC